MKWIPITITEYGLQISTITDFNCGLRLWITIMDKDYGLVQIRILNADYGTNTDYNNYFQIIVEKVSYRSVRTSSLVFSLRYRKFSH